MQRGRIAVSDESGKRQNCCKSSPDPASSRQIFKLGHHPRSIRGFEPWDSFLTFRRLFPAFALAQYRCLID